MALTIRKVAAARAVEEECSLTAKSLALNRVAVFGLDEGSMKPDFREMILFRMSHGTSSGCHCMERLFGVDKLAILIIACLPVG